MNKINKEIKLIILIIGLTLYMAFMLSNLGSAWPQGADVTNISNSTYSRTPGSRSDPRASITTLNLDVTQQSDAWKAYVGNITGSLVLRNSDGWSIFQWALNASSMSGNIFVSRNDTITWTNLKCANSTIIESEQTFLGISTASAFSINNTFNYTTHKNMTIDSVTIDNSTCPSTATWVNGSAQTITQTPSTYFQEILLYDNTHLIYATFVDQNAWSYNNNESVGGANVTYDFQLILAENSTSSGTTYYFFADIS